MGIRSPTRERCGIVWLCSENSWDLLSACTIHVFCAIILREQPKVGGVKDFPVEQVWKLSASPSSQVDILALKPRVCRVSVCS